MNADDRNQHRSSASVATDRPDRYAKQLISHLGARAEVERAAGATVLGLSMGVCEVRVVRGAIELQARAADVASLHRLEGIVQRHLERFGDSDDLEVNWRATGAGGA